MGKFDSLTEYIPFFEKMRNFGEWEDTAAGSHVHYTEDTMDFVKDVMQFINKNIGDPKELEGEGFGELTKSDADVNTLDAKSALSLIAGAIRAEHFCEGALLEFFENGKIINWLKRLRALDV